RMHAIERGRDVRRFALVATGGAGPVHAWSVARRLGVRRLVLPPGAGVASAFGMLTAPPAFDHARSLPAPLAAVDWAAVRAAVAEMGRDGRLRLRQAGVAGAAVTGAASAGVRYRGRGGGGSRAASGTARGWRRGTGCAGRPSSRSASRRP